MRSDKGVLMNSFSGIAAYALLALMYSKRESEKHPPTEETDVVVLRGQLVDVELPLPAREGPTYIFETIMEGSLNYSSDRDVLVIDASRGGVESLLDFSGVGDALVFSKAADDVVRGGGSGFPDQNRFMPSARQCGRSQVLGHHPSLRRTGKRGK
jgi:hypothetical protein